MKTFLSILCLFLVLLVVGIFGWSIGTGQKDLTAAIVCTMVVVLPLAGVLTAALED